MLRRLLLGQPRRSEIKDAEKEIGEQEKRILDLPRKKSTDLEDEHNAREDDIYDSDSETDDSDTEDSDSDTLDNSSRTGSCEDCSADVLAWKGFEVIKDIRPHETSGNFQEQNGEKKNQENPFKNAFDTEGNELVHDETKSEGTYRNDNDKKIKNSNSRKENDASCNKNDDHNNNDEYDNKSKSTNIQAYNKQAHQLNDNETATATEAKLPSGQPTRTDQLKIPLQLPKSTANEKAPNGKAKRVSRNYSIRENKSTSSSKRQTYSKINTEGKPSPATKIPDKCSVGKAQNSVIRRRDIGKDKAGFSETRPGNKPKQGNVNPSHISVSDLESVLGVNVTELREVIMKYKAEKVNTAEDLQGQGQLAAECKMNLQGMSENNLVDGKKSRCKNDKIKEGKGETIDNKDEISSDSGVSEPDAHSTDRQPHYTTLKAIIKRKKYIEGQIKVLEDRIVVMGDHKKDIQVIHDLFDLHNDGLQKVERSNGGLPCLESLKSILACQLREIDEDEFRAKLKSLEDLGIPNISEISERIEKLRKRIRHALDDERKCRSKGVQKLRFEIGKVQGMCEAVLDLVYTE